MDAEFGENCYGIKVTDPVVNDKKLTKHVLYKVRGCDSAGAFEVMRRYKDFVALRKILVQRWPGCVVPSIPPKQLIVATI